MISEKSFGLMRIRYPDLVDLLDYNPILSSIVLQKYKNKTQYLSYLNSLISDLKRLKCQNLTKKIKEPNDLVRFYSFTAEMITAKILAEHGSDIKFLTSEDFEKPSSSPDILGNFSRVPIYFEVTRFKDSDAVDYVFEELNEFLQNKPYVVNISLNDSLSEPSFSGSERVKQEKIIKRAVTLFKDRLKNIEVEDSPREIQIEGVNFILSPSRKAHGYLGIIEPSVTIFPEKKFEKYVSDRLLEKARKRLQFKGESRKIPYVVVFLSDDSSIDDIDFEDLLNGKDMRGLFSSSPVMKNVSGVILITKVNDSFFYPNPFCYNEIKNSEISTILNF